MAGRGMCPDPHIQHTITLIEEEGLTTPEIILAVLSAGPNADQFLAGMQPGLEQLFNQLVDLLAR